MNIPSRTLRMVMVMLVFCSVVACQKRSDQGGSGSGTYSVVITSYDQDRKITAVKSVRENTGSGLAEAKALVESVPATVKKGLTEAEAQSLAKTLESAGLKTKVTKE